MVKLVKDGRVARIDIESARSGRRKMIKQLTAIIEREGDGYVALCPEVDVASQGR